MSALPHGSMVRLFRTDLALVFAVAASAALVAITNFFAEKSLTLPNPTTATLGARTPASPFKTVQLPALADRSPLLTRRLNGAFAGAVDVVCTGAEFAAVRKFPRSRSQQPGATLCSS